MTPQTSLRRLLVASCAGAATVVVLPRAIPMLANTGLMQPAAADDTQSAAGTEDAQADDRPARRSGRKTAALAVCLAYPSYRAWKTTRSLRARFAADEN